MKEVHLFWHVAVMGRWREIVDEQAALFRSVGLRPKIGRVGPHISGYLSTLGDVIFKGSRLSLYETPTQQRLWEFCCGLEKPEDHAVIYCHTKGASVERRDRHRAWRKLMEYWVISRWRENLPLLDDHDAVGWNWRNDRWRHPFFAGTFWMASASYIKTLQSPWQHRRRRVAMWSGARTRYAAEHWIYSPGIRVVSLGCENTKNHRLSNFLSMLRECGHPEYNPPKKT